MNANRLRLSLLLLFVIISIVFSANVFAEDLPRLFAPVKTTEARQDLLSVDTDTVYVDVELSMLRESATAPARLMASVPGKTLVLIKRTSLERTADNYTWTGSVEGDDVSTVVMTVVGGILNGTISTSDDSYSIVPANGAYAVVRKDPSLSVRNPEDQRIPRIEEDADFFRNNSVSRSAQQEDGSRIDLLVLYTQKMQTTYGSGLSSKIQHFVDLANTAYINNGITLQLNLVGTQLLSDSGAAESVDISTALEYISGTTGSCSSANYPSPPQTVKSLRDSYNADLVSLLRAYDGTGAYCGLAWTMTSLTSSCDPYFGYSVVEVKDAGSGGYYCDEITLAHETGHNLGASHDRTTGCSGLFPYSCGYYTSDQKYGTIMSYIGNTIVTYFSSPSATYSGYTLGVSDSASNSADNASTINSTKSVVANYRYSSTVTCTYTISPASQTVAASGGSGSISVTASSSICTWTATASDSWLTINSGSSGTGSGTVSYSASSNASGTARTGTITIGGQTFTITQSGTTTTALTHTLTAPSNNNVSRGSIFGPIASSITNNSSTTSTGYLWASVYTPKGSWVDTVYLPLTLSAGQTLSNNGIMRLIPSLADTGAYSFCEYIYDTSWKEIDHKCVSFNVQ